jgi:hypothetical protein
MACMRSRALDAKIAFCQSLVRRRPLAAGMSRDLHLGLGQVPPLCRPHRLLRSPSTNDDLNSGPLAARFDRPPGAREPARRGRAARASARVRASLLRGVRKRCEESAGVRSHTGRCSCGQSSGCGDLGDRSPPSIDAELDQHCPQARPLGRPGSLGARILGGHLGTRKAQLLAIFERWTEQERARVIERTKAGFERARKLGKRLGRPRCSVIALHAAPDAVRFGMSIRSTARVEGEQ